jgi:hypothetical protein
LRDRGCVISKIFSGNVAFSGCESLAEIMLFNTENKIANFANVIFFVASKYIQLILATRKK